jgi:uncharacterized membrane protein/3-hydroxymyristoyl/3-hydroxydecanoyl-(acyl carrier protein) dehydratase
MGSLSQVRRFVAVALAVAYPLLAHAASTCHSRPLTIASVVVLAAAVLYRPLVDRRQWAYLALPVVALMIAGLARLDAVALVLFAPPVLLNAYLAWLFGHTLAYGNTPLIERLVRLLQPPELPFEPGVISYARTLTRLWTAFFILLGATNLALAALATPGGLFEVAGIRTPVMVSIETWSLFANVLNYLLVAAVFLVEFTYRRRRFPGRPYRNLLDFFRRSASVAPALAATFNRKSPISAAPARTIKETGFAVPEDHPAFAGHFPGRPVLPAVVLLDMVIESARSSLGMHLIVTGLPRAKFMAPLGPGDRGTIRLKLCGDQLEFGVSRGGARVAQGVFQLRTGGRPGGQ